MREMAMRRMVIGVDWGMKEVRSGLKMETRTKTHPIEPRFVFDT